MQEVKSLLHAFDELLSSIIRLLGSTAVLVTACKLLVQSVKSLF